MENTEESVRGRMLPGLTAGLVVLLIGLVVGGVLLARPKGDQPSVSLLVVARTEAVNFFSLDYRHAPADVDRVLALATGTFKTQYAARRNEVINGVQSKKLVVTAVIPADGAAIEHLDAEHGQVLVAVDVRSTSATGSDANQYRTRIQLTRVDGHWLVSGVDQVG